MKQEFYMEFDHVSQTAKTSPTRSPHSKSLTKLASDQEA
jgi:hypothetical protein